MKFEFNSRTGTMEPKKNEQIYFARAMSGGLRIDDNKNNIIYIIERNGDLKIVSGTRMKHMNIYDNRDAHIIAERVKRMFGVSHPYADYKKFMRGFRTSESQVKKFEDFVTEGMWGSALRRSNTAKERKDDEANRIQEFINKQREPESIYITDDNVINSKSNIIIRDTDLINGKLPFKFGRVDGYFDCDGCPSLTSLEGAPQKVGGNFYCRNCPSLTSHEGAPKKIGGRFIN